MKQILPGVSRVWICECESVPEDSELMGVAMGVKPVISGLEEQTLYGEGELSMERDRDGAMGFESVTLVFRSSEDIGRTRGLCVCVRDVNGNDFLIGSRERGARISGVHRIGTPSGDASGWTHTVTYSGITALLECIIAA